MICLRLILTYCLLGAIGCFTLQHPFQSGASYLKKIQPSVYLNRNSRSLYSVLVLFNDHLANNDIKVSTKNDRHDWIKRLEHRNNEKLDNIRNFVSTRSNATVSTEYTNLWVASSALVKDIYLSDLGTLAQQEEVKSIHGDISDMAILQVAHMGEDVSKDQLSELQDRKGSWGIEKIHANQAWSKSKGKGIVVANVDTGVRVTHEAIKTKYRGYRGPNQLADHDYNWYDPGEFRNLLVSRNPYCNVTTPFDNVGHGTHTMGTMVGDYGIGVASEAKFIAAKGCMDGRCSLSGLLKASQWVIYPSKTDGSAPDASKGADVVSNSWGGGEDNEFFKRTIETYTKLGVIPVFAAGNKGPWCGTVQSPSNLPGVIAVGATDERDSLTQFSSRGPGNIEGALQKPEVSAPGKNILSATSSGDDTYAKWAGTSMACPHVSGLVALVLSEMRVQSNETGSFETVVKVLQTSADQKDLIAPNHQGIWPGIFHRNTAHTRTTTPSRTPSTVLEE